jgi:hypothetical protein
VIPNVLKDCGAFIFKGQAVPEVFFACFTAEDECTIILQNVGNQPSNDTASYPTRFESSTLL